MGTFLKILGSLILIAIITGFGYKLTGDDLTGDRIIGIAVLAGAFILMPCFIYHRWKGKDLKNYMLTDENLRKMKDGDKKKR